MPLARGAPVPHDCEVSTPTLRGAPVSIHRGGGVPASSHRGAKKTRLPVFELWPHSQMDPRPHSIIWHQPRTMEPIPHSHIGPHPLSLTEPHAVSHAKTGSTRSRRIIALYHGASAPITCEAIFHDNLVRQTDLSHRGNVVLTD